MLWREENCTFLMTSDIPDIPCSGHLDLQHKLDSGHGSEGIF